MMIDKNSLKKNRTQHSFVGENSTAIIRFFLEENTGTCYEQIYNHEVFMLHPFVGPLTAIIAGIIILIYPSILNYVVAIYLILTGLITMLGT